MVITRLCWSLPTHGIQVERPSRRELASALAMGEILSSGNYGSAFTVHFLSEEARELHGVVGDRAVAKVIHGEGVADPGSGKEGGTRRKGVTGPFPGICLQCSAFTHLLMP